MRMRIPTGLRWRAAGTLALAVTMTAPAVASEAQPCGGVEMRDGFVRLGTPLTMTLDADGEACVAAVANALVAHQPRIRSVTVAARAPAAVRAGGKALNAALRVAELLEKHKIPRFRISAVAPRSVAGETAGLTIAYTERVERRLVALVGEMSGPVEAGRTLGKLSPARRGAAIVTKDYVRTGERARAELSVVDGSRLRVGQQSLVQLGQLKLDADNRRKLLEIHVMEGRAEIVAARGLPDSRFNVTTRTAVAGVRGTRFRVGLDDQGQVTQLETLTGRVNLAGGGSGKSAVDVPAGFGSRIDSSGVPAALTALPAAPAVVGPRYGSAPVGTQLRWKAVKGATRYVVTVSSRADMVSDAEDLAATGTSVAVPADRSGELWWQVVATDAAGFTGPASKIHKVVLK